MILALGLFTMIHSMIDFINYRKAKMQLGEHANIPIDVV